MDNWKPYLLGTRLRIRIGGTDEEGLITDQTPFDVFIESPLLTGWVGDAVFNEELGLEDDSMFYPVDYAPHKPA